MDRMDKLLDEMDKVRKRPPSEQARQKKTVCARCGRQVSVKTLQYSHRCSVPPAPAPYVQPQEDLYTALSRVIRSARQ
jgi:hypothetical protein